MNGARSHRRSDRPTRLLAALVSGLLLSAPGLAPSGAASETAAPGSEALVHPIAAVLQPGVAVGDFEFYVDAAATAPASPGHVILTVQVQIPALEVLELTGADQARLRVRVATYEAAQAFARFTAAETERAGNAAEDAQRERDVRIAEWLEAFDDLDPLAELDRRETLQVEDRTRLRDTDYRLYTLALEVPVSEQVVDVRVDNLSKSKRGLLDRLRKRPMAATARVLVRAPDLAGAAPLAEPLFQVGHGRHQDYASRVYGLLNDSLHVRSRWFGDLPATVRMHVRNRAGETLLRDSVEVVSDPQRAIRFHASVNALPAGQFLLTLAGEGPRRAAAVTRSFDVVWSLTSWHKSRRDLDLEADLVLRESDYEVYARLPLGEKEAYMKAFWKEHDPTPDTAYNEVFEEFRRRVAYADANFSETRRGALTDRGRIYVRFGPPQEIQNEAVPSHLAGRGTEELVERVEDPYSTSDHPIFQENLAGAQGVVRERARQTHADQHSLVVGRARELLSYELWVYVGGGEPLLPEDEGVNIDTGLRILFVDTQGFGEFKLRKASAKLDIHGIGVAY